MSYVVAGAVVIGAAVYLFLASMLNDDACAAIARSSLTFKVVQQLLAACFV